MKITSIFFFAVLLCNPLNSRCQTFSSGYVIKNGEKKSGLVNFNPYKAKDKMFFKSSKSSTVEEVKAGETEFYLDQYKARFISVIDTTTKSSIYAQVVVEGPVTLATSGNSYFLSRQEKHLQINFVSEKDKVTVARARGLVKYFLSDCAADEIEKKLAALTPSIIVSVVETYNRCKGSAAGKIRPRAEFGLLAGVVIPTLAFDHSEFNYFDGQPGFKAGASMDVRPARFEKRVVFNLQAIVLQNNFKEKAGSPLSSLNIDLNHLTFRLPISAKFFFKPGQRGLFVAPGFSPYLVFNSNTNTTFVKFKSNGLAAFIGMGYETVISSRTRMVYAFRYEATFGESISGGNAAIPASAKISSLQFDLGIKF